MLLFLGLCELVFFCATFPFPSLVAQPLFKWNVFASKFNKEVWLTDLQSHASIHYGIIPLSMLSSHPWSSFSGCTLAKAESRFLFIAHCTIALHFGIVTTLKRTHSPFVSPLKHLHIWFHFSKFTRGRRPTSEDSEAWRIGFQNGLLYALLQLVFCCMSL